jgi:PHD/YefM family antitoxin component YafN of YafNO toxin-antitoxin module
VNNKPEAVMMSTAEYDRMRDVINAEEMRREGAEARKYGKAYTDADHFMKDLLADD